MNKLFDLNIEQVLEHWEPEHAVREIIANATMIQPGARVFEKIRPSGKHSMVF